MQEQMSDANWEIQQLIEAVKYYEKAKQDVFSSKEAEKFEVTIKKLNRKIKNLIDQHGGTIRCVSENYDPYEYVERMEDPISSGVEILTEWEWE